MKIDTDTYACMKVSVILCLMHSIYTEDIENEKEFRRKRIAQNVS